MESQAPRPKRISGDTKRKIDIETLTNQVSQYNDLFESTKRSYMDARTTLARAKQSLDLAGRNLKIQQERMREKETQYVKEMNKISRTKLALNKLLAEDDLKTKTKTQKKEQSVQRLHDARGGRKFDIAKLDKLPLDVVLYIGEFLMHNVRTKYLEDVYNPLPIFNKLRVNVKRDFITLALLNKKYFSHLTTPERNDAENKIHFAGCKTINDEIAALIHRAKHENPEGAHKLIKAMCILFEKNKKYKDNWHAFYAERTRLRDLGN
jgi:hypothetical protein